jgi:hypothetical protein
MVADSNGSASDGQDLRLTAGKMTSKLSGQTADLDGRQCPAISIGDRAGALSAELSIDW